jgi:hypothetical protein
MDGSRIVLYQTPMHKCTGTPDEFLAKGYSKLPRSFEKDVWLFKKKQREKDVWLFKKKQREKDVWLLKIQREKVPALLFYQKKRFVTLIYKKACVVGSNHHFIF